MQRVYVKFQFKKLAAVFIIFIIFVIAMSIFIVGIGNKESYLNNNNGVIQKFRQNSDDAVLKKTSGEIKVKIYMSQQDKIAEIPLEEYVRGVVAAEMPANFGVEALKAQAVAARTYVLGHMTEFGGNKCSIGKGADICDTVHCQAYMDKEKRYNDWNKSEADIYWSKITDAVKDTAGKVLTYEGKLVLDPYYFAMSSGKTENAVDVFAYDKPYLRSVESEGDKNVKDFQTTTTYTYDKLSSIINNKYPKANVSPKKLKSQVNITDRTSGGGSVKNMKVGSISITGRQFRELLGLRSSNFDIVYGSKNIQVVAKGSGHGVGMSQWGASIMAKEGNSYDRILIHYYQGVKIENIENIK